MSEKKHNVVGGNAEQSLQGDYNFDISSLFRQGWELTQEKKWIVVQMSVALFAIAMCVVAIAMNAFGITDFRTIEPQLQFYIDMMLTVIVAPFITAIMLTCINHTVGGKSQFSHLFHLLPKALILGLTSLMIAIIIQLGMTLFILPGLYLAIATGFTLTLVAEKGLRPGQAILLSIRVVNRYWLGFIKLYGIFLLLFIASIATMGVLLIWVVPLYYHVKGVLYRDLFGVGVSTYIDQNGENKNESIFHA